jgi:hypothetical protein
MRNLNSLALLAVLMLSARFANSADLCSSSTMFVNGSHTSWVPQPMVCNQSTAKWELKSVVLPGNSFVGFDVQGNWKHTIGGRGGLSGKVSNKFENIWVSNAGIYDIEIDLQQRTYALVASESQDIGYTRNAFPDLAIGNGASSLTYGRSKSLPNASCSKAACETQYARDNARCKKLPIKKARALCYAASTVRYGACRAKCRK